jgi:hypothetical protein
LLTKFENTELKTDNEQETHNNMTIPATKLPIQGDESIMSEKKHGTSETAVQKDLRWGCDYDTADRICNFNRHYAGKFLKK